MNVMRMAHGLSSRRCAGAVAVWVSGLSLAGCLDLPEESLIADERVLALRGVPADTDPANDVPVRAEFSPGERVMLEGLIASPQGALPTTGAGALETRWLACIVADGAPAFSCVDAATPFDQSPAPCPTAQDDLVDVFPELCELTDVFGAGWAIPTVASLPDRWTVGLTAAVARPGGSVDTCTQALLDGAFDTPEECVYSGRTLVVASELGPVPDTHPRLESVTFERRNADDEILSSGSLHSNMGTGLEGADHLRLTVQFPEADAQAFEDVIDASGTTESFRERISAEWFSTSGLLEGTVQGPPALTDAKLSIDWFPNDESGAAATTFWVVLRDGRSGQDWLTFQIEP